MKKEHISTEEKTHGVVLQKDKLTPETAKELSERNTLTVYIGDKPHKIFLTYGFYYHRNDFSSYHSHSSYHEVIIIIGNCEYIVGDKIINLEDTNAIVMPPKVYHKMQTTENVEVCTFFIDADIDFTVKPLPNDIVRSFFKETERVYETKDYSVVVPFISLIMSYLLPDSNTIKSEPASDYGILIDVFFNLHYMDDVSLEDLADYLHVSVTHAHRLVQKHTGSTFTEELTVRRLKVADFLVKHRGMTLTKAAEAVGFRSYTGFWKARSKYEGKF